MHLTWDVSLGNLLTVATLVGILLRLGWVAGTIQSAVVNLTAVVNSHAQRLDKYEDALIKIVGQMQHMVGRVEGVQDRLDRYKGV